MKRIVLLLCIFLFANFCRSQLLSWTPDFPKDNDNITITADATKGNQGLLGFSGNVYVHLGVITNLSTGQSNWRYSKFTWGSTEAAALATPAGTNKWSYTINNIRTFFGVPAGETIQKIAILFRAGNCTDCLAQRNADQSDMYVPVYNNDLAVRYNEPLMQPLFTPVPEPINKMVGENINVRAVASSTADMKLFLNGNVIQTVTAVTSISANATLSVAGNQTLVAEAVSGTVTKTETINFFVAGAPTIAELPAGVRDGINYEPGNTSVVLVLNAPGKNRVSVIGSFPGGSWIEQTTNQMNKTPDNNYWWIRITGLTPGTEYTFQYLVDGQLKVADPYSEKILDPWNDSGIPGTTYPNLLPYPSQTSGIVSVLQTNAPAYNWQVSNFSRPDKRGLIIYELLLRDFLAAHDWKTLRDTLGYFKRMGINAIEIMPFNEFEGNASWGYNPDFFLAPDKYYGTKNNLKEFIDSCHSKGIAVLMDIALNHATGLCPLAALYWNGTTNQPAANNPWFNVTATHPYNVFNDFNHESLSTRYFTSRVVEHWLTEYKLDGFRWDLSKGFTQNTQCGSSTTNESCIAAYHADRVAIWKRYYDTMQLKSPGSYCILEHFCDNTEEIELSNYGMMLWGNSSYNFQEAAMGWVPTSNFEYGIFKVRNWTQPHLITYMESHDEERMMYKNLLFGNSSGSYNTKDLSTALKRMEMCASFFTMIPGPKMIWEFGELGYDYSINHCTNGTVNNNCRLDPKPIRWDYFQNFSRQRLFDIYAALLKLRFHPLYKNGFLTDRVTHDLAGAFKWLQLTTDTSNVCIIGNFDVNPTTGTVTFQNAGTWYDYLNGNTFTATGTSQTITLQPGEFHLYLNRNVTNVVTTPVSNINNQPVTFRINVYPNPLVQNGVLE
ncbi:MAG TPA: alpha-amylase family glycosyl hydrolase, partial [Chitinophagaceae bacterium]|nr:alpha-amylase family glycosyl hydrolase [Chitinophagaceae bacterium]